MKVYLSRSNAAEPAVFSIVQKAIEQLGHEVVTFNGGEYCKAPLLSCDALVVVPSANMLPSFGRWDDDDITKLTDDHPDIGKGQYEQCMDFAKKYARDYDKTQMGDELDDIVMKSDKLMLVVQEVDNSDSDNPSVYVNNITGVRTQDLDSWKHKYGFLTTDGCYNNIDIMLSRQVPDGYPVSSDRLVYPTSDLPMLGAAHLIGVL